MNFDEGIYRKICEIVKGTGDRGQETGARSEDIRNNKTEKNDSEFSRLNCLAKVNGIDEVCLQNSEETTKRGNVCTVGSNEESSSFDSIKYCGGACSQINERVSAFSDDCERFSSGVANTIDSVKRNTVSVGRGYNASYDTGRGNQQNDSSDSQEANDATLPPESSPLTPESVFDYIYAVLHSPSYRAKYKEFLKIDFPRIPYPKNAEEFARLAAIGAELRKLHLMEGADGWQTGVAYPAAGTNEVEKPQYDAERGRVYINAGQYFEGVPAAAWEFYIGGYQPAQKWLKDRKGRTLNFDDIEHYTHIIYALKRTAEIMRNEG